MKEFNKKNGVVWLIAMLCFMLHLFQIAQNSKNIYLLFIKIKCENRHTFVKQRLLRKTIGIIFKEIACFFMSQKIKISRKPSVIDLFTIFLT